MVKIYTKTGDKGNTALLSGQHVPKYHLRVESYGTIDELSSNLGFLRSMNLSEHIKNEIIEVQQVLFDISGLLACDKDKYKKLLNPVNDASIQKLERSIDTMTAELPALKKFILPGGQQEVGYIHVCRTVARRAERIVAKVAAEEKIPANIIKYVNRLSDYLFTLSRFVAHLNKFEQIVAK